MVTATSLKAARVPFFFAADADCPIGKGLAVSPDFETGLTSEGHYRRCGEYNQKMLARALRPDIRTVVLSSRWTNWRIGEKANPAEGTVDVRLSDAGGTSRSLLENRSKFEAAFAALVADLTHAGKRVVIVGPLPEPTYNVPHRVYVAGFGLAPAATPIVNYQERHRVILSFFEHLQKVPGVTVIWPQAAICGAICPVERNGVPIYFDHNHLTVDEAVRLAPLYRRLNSPA